MLPESATGGGGLLLRSFSLVNPESAIVLVISSPRQIGNASADSFAEGSAVFSLSYGFRSAAVYIFSVFSLVDLVLSRQYPGFSSAHSLTLLPSCGV